MEFILGRKGREGGRKRDFLGEEVVGTRRERSRERERREGAPSIANTGALERNPVAKKRIRRNGPLIKALGPNESSIYLPPTRR